MKIIITESQLKNIVEQVNKNEKKNASFTTTKDHVLTKNTTFGGDLKIPTGTKFTAHQSGNKKDLSMGGITYTASVDRNEGGKTKATTVYYCDGENAGKFWHADSKSWYYDKTKILSGYLSKNVCFKSDADQVYWEKKDKDLEKKVENQNTTDYMRTPEYKKNQEFLKSQGMVVDFIGSPMSANQHFAMSALHSMKRVTDIQANNIEWANSECRRIGLSKLATVNMTTKKFNTYDSSLISSINDFDSPIYTHITTKLKPTYANFFLSDFYFKWGELKKVVDETKNLPNNYYFPEGVYNFYAQYYGTTNVSQIVSVIKQRKTSCVGGGLTAEQGHQVISTLTFVSAFIPVVGPFLAAGLGTADAALLWSQGKKAEAGLTLAFSIIPFASEIPALKNIGSAALENIAGKVTAKLPLNPEELNIVSKINGAKAEFDGIAKKYIASKTKDSTVQEFIKISKEKGEEYLVDKISEKTGVPLKPKDLVKKEVTGLAQKYDKSQKPKTT